MARKAQPSGSNGVRILLFLLCALLLLGSIYGYYLLKSQPQPATIAPGDSIATTADSTPLISDDRIIFGGIPRPKNPDTQITILKNLAYMVGYSETRKDPLFSAYRVKKEQPFELPRPKGNFLTDTRTRAQVVHADYTGSGYDRGHMTPNSAIARCYGADAQKETFLLSNIVPQSPNLNREVWEHLEKEELEYAKQAGEVWIIDGPVFDDTTDPSHPAKKLQAGIAIPDACYKILIEDPDGQEKNIRVFAVIMPQSVNGTEHPSQFTRSIKDIETQTGLEFLWKLPPEERERLESKAYPMWQN